MSDMNEPVPMLDLSGQFRDLQDEWMAAIQAAGASGQFILGPQVAALEQEIARYVGVTHAVGVANGTDAILLALRALGIGPGDEVITTPFTFFASSEVIDLVGARPVFADIDPKSFCLDPESVRASITPRTRAIIAVHLFGHPADMEALMAIGSEHGLAVIEDCAQAFGAVAAGGRVGSIGAAGTFSFYPTKVLGCYGDGGMVVANSDEMVDGIRRLRNHGATAPFMHSVVGYNSRLDEIHAALLRIKLARIESAIKARQRVAASYDELLSGLGLGLPARPAHGEHVFNLYTVRTPHRDRVREGLTHNRIGTSVCYPLPLHLQEVYRSLGYRAGELPVAEEAAREVLSLPIYPELTTAQIERVCTVVRAALVGAGV